LYSKDIDASSVLGLEISRISMDIKIKALTFQQPKLASKTNVYFFYLQFHHNILKLSSFFLMLEQLQFERVSANGITSPMESI
jgi:hypothetical protein